MRPMNLKLTVLTITAVVALLIGAADTSFAQTVPYKASGDGFYSPVTGDYGGTGDATHLGLHTFLGDIATAPTAHPLVFLWESTAPQETVAANGDTIFFSAAGIVELIPLDETFTTFSAIWTGEFVVEGGTGRFADVQPAAEPLSVMAINDPFTFADPEWTFAWELNGEINLR